MKNMVTILSVLVVLAHASLANSAPLIGVKEIEIRSAISPTDYLQVSELVATETSTSKDLALLSEGATATSFTSGGFYFQSPDNAIDGDVVAPPNGYPDLFHSGTNGAGEFLRITLANPSILDSLTIFGRTDDSYGSFGYRDIYNIKLFNSEGGVLFSATNVDATGDTHSATVDFAPVPEPSSLLLMGTGLLATGIYMWRRGQTHQS